jgi:hypothetical protein
MNEQKPPYEPPAVEELDVEGDTVATNPGITVTPV